MSVEMSSTAAPFEKAGNCVSECAPVTTLCRFSVALRGMHYTECMVLVLFPLGRRLSGVSVSSTFYVHRQL